MAINAIRFSSQYASCCFFIAIIKKTIDKFVKSLQKYHINGIHSPAPRFNLCNEENAFFVAH